MIIGADFFYIFSPSFSFPFLSSISLYLSLSSPLSPSLCSIKIASHISAPIIMGAGLIYPYSLSFSFFISFSLQLSLSLSLLYKLSFPYQCAYNNGGWVNLSILKWLNFHIGNFPYFSDRSHKKVAMNINIHTYICIYI